MVEVTWDGRALGKEMQTETSKRNKQRKVKTRNGDLEKEYR